MSSKQHHWFYGIHCLQAFIEEAPHRILQAFCAEPLPSLQEPRGQLFAQLEALGLKVQLTKFSKLSQMVGSTHHQGLVVEGLPEKPTPLEKMLARAEDNHEKPRLLILDQLVDPQNLGACFRSAYAAGFHGLIRTQRRSAPLSATVRKVACGATEKLPWLEVVNLHQTLQTLGKAGCFRIGLAAEATHSIYALESSLPAIAVVLGAEGKGLRSLTRRTCDRLCAIPMFDPRFALNASAAAAVACFEVTRRFGNPKRQSLLL